MILTFVTGNPGKLAEARAALEPLGHKVIQDDRGYPEVQADTLEAVARAGIDHLAGRIDGPFFLEDAGLFVNALRGFPGVYSSYAYKTIGNPGILRLLEGGDDRAARFEARIAYHDGATTRVFEGTCPGRVATEARGDGGFGFDPIFVPEGHERTFAELDVKEKEAVSHRGRAVEAFAEFLGDR